MRKKEKHHKLIFFFPMNLHSVRGDRGHHHDQPHEQQSWRCFGLPPRCWSEPENNDESKLCDMVRFR